MRRLGHPRGGPNQYDERTEAPREREQYQERSGSREDQVQRIKSEALQALDDAYARSADQQTAKLKTKLGRAIINISNRTPCGPADEGYAGCAEVGGNQMWLPDLFFSMPPSQQVFIVLHETAHLIGIGNECASDRLVRKVMEDAGLPFEPSGYDQICGAG